MQEHGRWRIDRLGKNLIVTQAFDSWNDQAVSAYLKELTHLLVQFESTEWVIISDARYWDLTTAEGIAKASEFVRSVKGLVCFAIVISNAMQKAFSEMALNQLDPVYTHHHYPTSIDDALDVVE